MTHEQRSRIRAMILDEVRRSEGRINAGTAVLNALDRAEVDLRRQPTLEETKLLLVEAARAIGQLRFVNAGCD